MVNHICFGWGETRSTVLAVPMLIHNFRVLFAHCYKNIFGWSKTFVLLEISVESLFCRVHWFVFITKHFYLKFFIVASASGKCLPFFKGSTIGIWSCSIFFFGGNICAISFLLLCTVCLSGDFWIWTWRFHFLNIIAIRTNYMEVSFLSTYLNFEALNSFLSTINFEDVRRPQSKFQSLDCGAHS